MSHVVNTNQLDDWSRKTVTRCEACYERNPGTVVLCGYHENLVAATATVERLVYGHTREAWAALTDDERQVITGSRAPVGECPTCDRARATGDKATPSHTAKDRCRSGKYPHCTCDTCY